MDFIQKLSKFVDDKIIDSVKPKVNVLEMILWEINNVLVDYSKIKFSEKEILQMVWEYNDSLYYDVEKYKQNPWAFILYSQCRFFDKDVDSFTFCTTFDSVDYVFRTHIAGILALSDNASKDLLYSEIEKLKNLRFKKCSYSLIVPNQSVRYNNLLEIFWNGFFELENRKTQAIDKDNISKRSKDSNSFLDST